jgi:hypothetical protein
MKVPKDRKKFDALNAISNIRILLQASKPLMPGIFTSNRIRFGCSRRTAVIASLPFLASMTSYPLLERVACSTRRICGSSSTTRIVALLIGPVAFLCSSRRPSGLCRGIDLRTYREPCCQLGMALPTGATSDSPVESAESAGNTHRDSKNHHDRMV